MCIKKCREAERKTEYKEESNQNEMEFMAAVDKALDEMPDDFLIKSFLLDNREKVKNMCLNEYIEKKYSEQLKGEGRNKE